MSKAPNKLTAGLRKVKEKQPEAPVPRKRAQPEASAHQASSSEGPAAQAVRAGHGTGKHPTRIWPD